MRPVVERYDAAWASRGQQLARELRDRLGPLALRVEHIGGTSIAQMAAKPVLDFQVSVSDLAAAAAAFDAPLAELGLQRRPFERDHVPAGVDDDADRWAKRFWAGEVSGQRVHLHARVAGAPNERLPLLFRDWFRAHPQAVAAYSRFKRLLGHAVADAETYTDVKDPIVDVVVAAAEEWALASGWAP